MRWRPEREFLEATRRSDAARTYLQALALLESWRGRLALGDLRMEIAEPRWTVYEGAVRTLLQQGDIAGSFAVGERARARLLLELIAERDASQPSGSQVAALRRRLSERYVERAAVEAPSERAELDRTLVLLTDSLAALEAAERVRDPSAAARYPSPAPLDELRAGLLGKRRALLTFFWGDSAVYGWWVTDTAIHAARLGSADSLATLVDFLRSEVDNPASGTGWTIPAERVFRELIAPLRPDDADEILVVPDGPLAYVPLEVLIPSKDARPWGATRRVVYGPSASVLLALTRTRASARRWERSVLAVGNPAPSNGPDASGKLRSFVAAATRPLPYAEEEARAIGASCSAAAAPTCFSERTRRRRAGSRPIRPGTDISILPRTRR